MEDEEDLYDCVYDDGEGEEVYEDLMKAESVPPPVGAAFTSLAQRRAEQSSAALTLFSDSSELMPLYMFSSLGLLLWCLSEKLACFKFALWICAFAKDGLSAFSSVF